MEMNRAILKGMIRALPHNVQGTPVPRNMMPQLKAPDLNKYDTEQNTQFPVSQIRPVQKDRVDDLVATVYYNFDG